MAKFDSTYDWDHLNDEDWNKTLDEHIDRFNEGRGEIELPPAPHAIMDDEYVRGINYEVVTADLIRHYADAIGDPNLFWRDPSYVKSTRWGGFIAPPTFETCIAFGSSFGGRLRVPGIARLAAGNKHDYFVPIRPGDKFTIYDKYGGFVEKDITGKPYRMFIESVPRYYINQRDEVAAIATHRNIYMATPPGKRGKRKEAKMYQGKERHFYNQEELDMIHQAYDDQLSGVNRRGAKVRYWEDVVEGEEIPTVIKGPIDVADACARTMVSCYPYAFAIKWAVMRNHLQHHPRDPETNEHILRRDWHYTDHAAKIFGYPYANSAGIQNEMMLVHAATDWMGDDGWVKSVDSQDRRMLFFGDMTFIKGKVGRKYVENGEHLVELNVWGETQDGVVHTRSDFTIKLVTKAEFDRPLYGVKEV